MTFPSPIKGSGNSEWTGLEIDSAWFGAPAGDGAFLKTFDDLLAGNPEGSDSTLADQPSNLLGTDLVTGEGDAMEPSSASSATFCAGIDIDPSVSTERVADSRETPPKPNTAKALETGRDSEPTLEGDAALASDTARSVEQAAVPDDAGPEAIANRPDAANLSGNTNKVDTGAFQKQAWHRQPGAEGVPIENPQSDAVESSEVVSGPVEDVELESAGDLDVPPDGEPDGVTANPLPAGRESRVDQGDSKVPNLTSKLSGTVAAKLNSDMENRQEQNEFADAPEQNLPEQEELVPVNSSSIGVADASKSIAGSVDGNVPPKPLEHSAQLRMEPVEEAVSADSTDSTESAEAVESSDDLEAMRPMSPARMIERMRGQISQIAVELRRFDARTLSVVLRPDGMTRLAVQLTMESGQVDMRARFESGDFAGFNSHWPQLQRELAEVGIRVAPLDAATAESAPRTGRDAGGWSPGNSDSDDQGFDRDRPGRPSPAASEGEPASRAKAPAEGWERWA